MQKVKKIPQRQCVGCREMKDKKSLLRVVKSPEGVVSLDFVGKKPGSWRLCVPRCGMSEKSPEIQSAGTCFQHSHPPGGL